MKIIGVYNQKGGSGKTTTSVSLSAIFATMGYKTIICDSDGQINATQYLLSDDERYFVNGIFLDDVNNLGTLMTRECTVKDCVITKEFSYYTAFRKHTVDISIIPGHPRINYLNFDSMFCLKEQLQDLHDYEYMFIDISPSDSTAVAVTLAACDYVICPTEADIDGLNGFKKLMDLIEDLNINYDTDIKILGMLVNKYMRVRGFQQKMLDGILTFDQSLIFNTYVPNDPRVPEARAFNTPLEFFARSCPANKAFHAIANEILDKLMII